MECQKTDNSALMETVCRNAFSGSVAYGKRWSEMISTVEALNHLTLCILKNLN